MTDDSYLLDGNDKKKVNWFGRLLKIAFVLIAFGLVIITVLANMGGNSDTLKQGIVQFVSEMFGGRPVTVETLNNMSFFPRVGIDVEGINVISRPENGTKIMSVGKLQAYMGFWQVATRKPRLKGFYLEDVRAIKGALTPNELYIEKIYIDHDIETGTAELKGLGTLGVHPWNFTAGMQVFGAKGKYDFMLAHSFPIQFEIADITFETVFINHEDNYFKLENFVLSQGDKAISGNILLSALGKNLIKIKADLHTKDSKSAVNADLVADLSEATDKYSGTLTSEKMVLSEILGDDSVFTIFKRIRDLVGYTKLQEDKNPMAILGSNNLQLELDFSNILVRPDQLADLKIPLHLDQGHLRLGHILAVPVEKDIITITRDLEDKQDVSYLKPYLPIIPDQISAQKCTIENAGKKLDTITLEAFSYNFVQASLREKSENNECAQRVLKAPDPEPEEDEEAQEGQPQEAMENDKQTTEPR